MVSPTRCFRALSAQKSLSYTEAPRACLEPVKRKDRADFFPSAWSSFSVEGDDLCAERAGYRYYMIRGGRRPVFPYRFVNMSTTAWKIFVNTLHILVNGPTSSSSASSISEISVASSSSLDFIRPEYNLQAVGRRIFR